MNHPTQRMARNVGRSLQKKRRLSMAIEQRRADKRKGGLFLCPAECPTPNRYCRKEFLSAREQEAHFRRCDHDFPRGITAQSAAVYQAAKPGGLVAAGSRPNSQNKAVFCTIEEAEAGALGLEYAICHGKFNRKEGMDVYHKPEFLRRMLIKHFEIGQDGSCPKLKDKEILKILSEMRDEDGGLMFCYSKRGSWPRDQFCDLCQKDPCNCNGMLPPLWMVSQFMNTLTQKKKRAKKQQQEPGDGNG